MTDTQVAETPAADAPVARKPSKWVWIAAGVVLLLVVAVGVVAVIRVIDASTGKQGLDMSVVKTSVAQGVRDKTGINLTKIDCPVEVVKAKDVVTDCTVTAVNGSKGTIRVRQTDNLGSIDWTLNP